MLRALYDSELNVTITMLGDGGADFAFISYMELDNAKPDDWHNVPSSTELADAIHVLAMKTYPASADAKQHRTSA